MQEQNFTGLMHSAFKDSLDRPNVVKKKMSNLAKKNEKDLSEKPLPDYLRIPTAEELIEIRQWAIDYKKSNKNASKREVRRATQQHFNIKIYR